MKNSTITFSVQKSKCNWCKKDFFESEDWPLDECPYCEMANEIEEGIQKFEAEVTIDFETSQVTAKYRK